jgi:hypothetical protein
MAEIGEKSYDQTSLEKSIHKNIVVSRFVGILGLLVCLFILGAGIIISNLKNEVKTALQGDIDQKISFLRSVLKDDWPAQFEVLKKTLEVYAETGEDLYSSGIFWCGFMGFIVFMNAISWLLVAHSQSKILKMIRHQ